MDGLVDLHTHALPGVDDGSDNLEESLQMLAGLREQGFSHIFITPHHRLDSWKGIEPEVVLSGVRSLQQILSRKDLDIKLYPGLEYDLDETLWQRVADRPGKAQYVLVDMGFWDVAENLEGLFGRVQEMGIEILLAHPERNFKFCQRKDLVRSLLDSGIRFIGNLGSLAGYYGRQIRRDCRLIVKEGRYWAMATDLHSPEMLPWIRNGLKELEQHAGEAGVRELLYDHPIKVAQSLSEGQH